MLILLLLPSLTFSIIINKPTQQLFGRLNLSSLKESTSVKSIEVQIGDGAEHWQSTGVTISFYLVSVNVSDTAQLLFSLYGSTFWLRKNSESKCSISVSTNHKLQISYELKGCENRYIILEVHPPLSSRIVSVYDNLVPLSASGEPVRDWCEYENTVLKRDDSIKWELYTYSTDSHTLDSVKEICLNQLIDDRRCSGITLFDTDYILSVATTLQPAESNQKSWLSGPCAGVTTYKILVTTSKIERASTRNDLYIKIYGSNAVTDIATLVGGFSKRSTKSYNHQLADVGEILCVELFTQSSNNYILDEIQIKNISSSSQWKTFIGPADTQLSNNSEKGVPSIKMCVDTMELVFYKTDTPVELAHFSVNPLESLSKPDEVIARYKRFEMGSMVMGPSHRYQGIGYNAEFAFSDGPLAYADRYSIEIEDVSPFSLDEGSFIQESKQRIKNTTTHCFVFGINAVGPTSTANYLWNANGKLYADSTFCRRKGVTFETSTQLGDVIFTGTEASELCIADKDCCGYTISFGMHTLYRECEGLVESDDVTDCYCKGFCSEGETVALESEKVPESEYRNIAFEQPAYQESTYYLGGEGNVAVDGDTNGDYLYGNGSVTHTNSQDGGWWSVLLPRGSYIAYIIIFNRMDSFQELLGGATVYLDEEIFGSIHQVDGVQEYRFSVRKKGSVVKIAAGEYATLQLAEVEVWGFVEDNNKEVHVIKLWDLEKPVAEITLHSNVYVYSFEVLPVIEVAETHFVRHTTDCTWSKDASRSTFTNPITIILTFKTQQTSYTVKTPAAGLKQGDKIEETIVSLDDVEEDVYYMHVMEIANDIRIVTLKGMLVADNECAMRVYNADVCYPKTYETNYGAYYLGRLLHGEQMALPCTENPSQNMTWTCNSDGGMTFDATECLFRWCYDKESRTHDVEYVGHDDVIQEIEAEDRADGACCGGEWSFVCEEDYFIDYTRCRAISDCTGVEEVQFEIRAADDTVSAAKISLASTTKRDTEETLPCGYSSGTLRVSCNGCTGKRTVISNTCKKQFCSVPDGVQQYGKSMFGVFNVTFEDGGLSYRDTLTGDCPHGGQYTIKCSEGELKPDYTNCHPAPRCYKEDRNVHPLIGVVSFPAIYATLQTSASCPGATDGVVTRNCTWAGTWAEPDYSQCEKGPCTSITFIRYGIKFTTGSTEPDEVSRTTCDDEMCAESGYTCGAMLCNSITGSFADPDYSTCTFDCSRDGTSIPHGGYSTSSCTRTRGRTGIKYLRCWNDELTDGSCVLATCSPDGGEGCVVTDKNEMVEMGNVELANDFSSFLDGDNVDFSNQETRDLTLSIVDAILPTTFEADTDVVNADMIKAVSDVVDKVAVKLSSIGGVLLAKQVNIYGIPNVPNGDSPDYLGENGISGDGFKGGIGLAVYKTHNLFSPSLAKDTVIGSFVKSITTEEESPEVEISINFKMDSKSKNEDAYRCQYYDMDTKVWSSDGCMKTDGSDVNSVTCLCDHLTSFAVLVSISDIDESAVLAQSMASQVLLSISSVCLAATLGAMLPFSKIRSREIVQIHLNLVFSNLLGCLAFMLIELGNTDVTLCRIFSFATHYCWLAVFGWMVAEGVTMYNQTVMALQSYGKKMEHYVFKVAAIVYSSALVLPLLGVILEATIPSFNYIKPSGSCFLDIPYALLFLFLIPLYLVMCLSIYFFVMVSMIIIQARKQGSRGSSDYWKKQLKAIITIATVTGIAWVISPLVLLGGSGAFAQVFQWLFIIVLGLQGVVVFVVQVVLNEEVRKAWMTVYEGSMIEKFGESVYLSFYSPSPPNESKENGDKKISEEPLVENPKRVPKTNYKVMPEDQNGASGSGESKNHYQNFDDIDLAADSGIVMMVENLDEEADC